MYQLPITRKRNSRNVIWDDGSVFDFKEAAMQSNNSGRGESVL